MYKSDTTKGNKEGFNTTKSGKLMANDTNGYETVIPQRPPGRKNDEIASDYVWELALMIKELSIDRVIAMNKCELTKSFSLSSSTARMLYWRLVRRERHHISSNHAISKRIVEYVADTILASYTT